MKSRDQDIPAFLIHTSGTGNLCISDIETGIYGEAGTKKYNDGPDLIEVTSLPDSAPHRTVDKLVLEADDAKLHTAIVCPPTIYGVARGPVNQRGHQLYELARCTLQRKAGFQVGAGKTWWPNVHVYDMSKCYLKLALAASVGGRSASWGKDGYYFTENGEHVWGDISRKVAEVGFVCPSSCSETKIEHSSAVARYHSHLRLFALPIISRRRHSPTSSMANKFSARLLIISN